MTERSAVAMLARYPLKSARGEVLDAVRLDKTGVHGDRIWACVDDTRAIGTLKQPRRWGPLLQVGASLGAGGDTVDVRVPGGSHRAGTPDADEALSRHLGFPVRLTDRPPPDPRMRRTLPDDPGLIPDWMVGARAGDEVTSMVAGVGRVGRFVDFAAVHIVTTGELMRLGHRVGSAAAAAARFRPNLVLDAASDPALGSELRVGDAVLRIVLPTPRCVVPGLAHDDLPGDPELLRALAGNYRVLVPGFGRAACFGTYAEVVRPGEVRLGQQVDIEATCEDAPV